MNSDDNSVDQVTTPGQEEQPSGSPTAKALVDELCEDTSSVSPTEAAPAEAEAEAEASKASADSSEKKSSDEDDCLIRVTKDSVMRKKIGVALGLVKGGKTVTISGFGSNIPKAISLASIVSDRVGEVHRVNSFVSEKDERSEKFGSGVQIVLSLSALDTEDVGYQRPKPKGYFASLTQVRSKAAKKDQAPEVKEKDSKPKDSSEGKEKQNREGESKPRRRRRQRKNPDAAKADSVNAPAAAAAPKKEQKSPGPKEESKSSQNQQEQAANSTEKSKGNRKRRQNRRGRKPALTDEAQAVQHASEGQKNERSEARAEPTSQRRGSVTQLKEQKEQESRPQRRRNNRPPRDAREEHPPTYRDFPPPSFRDGPPANGNYGRFEENLPPYRGRDQSFQEGGRPQRQQQSFRGRGRGGRGNQHGHEQQARPGFYPGERDFRGSVQPLPPRVERMENEAFNYPPRRFPYPSH